MYLILANYHHVVTELQIKNLAPGVLTFTRNFSISISIMRVSVGFGVALLLSAMEVVRKES